MRCLFSLLMLSWLFASGCVSINKQTIPLYVYHRYPPFAIPGQANLSKSFVKHLNRTTPYYWQLHVVNRADLNQLRSQGQPVAILWGNPKWFNNDPSLLVSTPILWDSDVIVYNREKPLLGDFPHAVLQKTLCTVKGTRFAAYEDLLASGKIQQRQADSQAECMALLIKGHVDFMQIPKSSLFANYSKLLGENIDLLNPVIDTYHRVILIDKRFAEALAPLNCAIGKLKNDPHWQKELTQFGHNRFIDLFDMNVEDLLQVEIRELSSP